MSCLWVSFVHDLNPNNHGQEDVPVWPEYVDNLDGKAGEWGVKESGFGGYGRSFVFQVNGTGSYVEDDTYRAAGIAAINRMWGNEFGK
jgi:hypothetical protein